ncbi:ECU06_0157 [Encephalitozoon cuniculi GB-M1]|uniref:ECU06_0157 protein n=1 Tax=Encephalitozoon cuniculi (strain GB-M1) TaxID=284813 RepID=I7L8I5_ENCCU|nr:uncharacterized protein ECU06_0157 [Encephalitozoon cuniculi GB-M1]UYI27599.1 ATP-dependent zinc metalloprotease FtsH [Encephalitozoon cuniculi]CCI73937.1 ECU06_0157 [Encephalitozoon cuniculi GB-M1]
MNILVEAQLRAEEVEEVKYDRASSTITMRANGKEYKYKIEESIETYILIHEQPVFVNMLGKEVRE